MAARDSQSKCWMVTLNNPELDVFDYCVGLSLHNWKYIFQIEIGENGTRHIQGFIDVNVKTRFSTMRTRLGDIGFGGCHLESVRARYNAINYCRKEATRQEGPFTNLSDYELNAAGQGRRRDLELLQSDIKEGRSRLFIAENHFNAFLQYNNGIMRYQQLLQKPREEKTRVLYLFGLPGVGKSRFALEVGKKIARAERNDSDIYYKTSGKWWDLYENHSSVIWDDFRGCDYRLSELLKLLDRYPYKIEVKGAVLEFNSKLIIITSNVMYNSLYQEGNEPIRRRIDFFMNVISYTNGGVMATTFENNHEEHFNAEEIIEILFE